MTPRGREWGTLTLTTILTKSVKCYIVIFVEPDSTAAPGGRTTAQVC